MGLPPELDVQQELLGKEERCSEHERDDADWHWHWHGHDGRATCNVVSTNAPAASRVASSQVTRVGLRAPRIR